MYCCLVEKESRLADSQAFTGAGTDSPLSLSDKRCALWTLHGVGLIRQTCIAAVREHILDKMVVLHERDYLQKQQQQQKVQQKQKQNKKTNQTKTAI